MVRYKGHIRCVDCTLFLHQSKTDRAIFWTIISANTVLLNKGKYTHTYIYIHTNTFQLKLYMSLWQRLLWWVSPDICTPRSPALIPPPNADLIWRKKLEMFLIKGTFGSYWKWHASGTGAVSLKPHHMWLPSFASVSLSGSPMGSTFS